MTIEGPLTDERIRAELATEPMTHGLVRFGCVDAIGFVFFDRPDVYNALDLEMCEDIAEAVERCDVPEVRVVLMLAAGPSFCSGAHVTKMSALDAETLPAYIADVLVPTNRAVKGMALLQAPVITAWQGHAIGGGVGLVCASDVVLAAESARLMVGFTRVGMGFECGLSHSLTQLVGQRRAMELAFTNRTVLGPEAAEIGLATRTVPDDRLRDEALQLAVELSAGPSMSFGAVKRAIRDGATIDFVERVDREVAITVGLASGPEAREGFAAVVERRAPRFPQRQP